MTRILLIDPSYKESRYLQQKDVYPHTGLLTIGTVLKQAGHTVKVVHLLADEVTDLPALIKEFKPDIAGVTFVTFQLKMAYAVLAGIKSISKDIITVVGGPHPSATNLVEHSNLDILKYINVVVSGEGEQSFLDIANNGVKQRFYKGQPCDINQLPELDLSLTDINRFAGIYPPGQLPSLPLICSRGCPFGCAFCSRSVFGKQVRFRKPELILNEIQHWADLGVKEVFFQDDTFNCNIKYCSELLEGLISRGLNKRMVFRARLRANRSLIDESLLSLMKRANFWLIFYGVEAGNQKMLDKMSKGLELAEIKRAFELTRKAGIKAEGSFIIGMPGETEDTIKDSLRFYDEIKPDWCSFNRAIPFPGTAFEQEARKSHHLVYPNYEDYRLNETLVRTEALTAEQLEYWATVADKVLLRNKVRRLIRQPRELWNVVKDAGIKGVMSRMVRLAR